MRAAMAPLSLTLATERAGRRGRRAAACRSGRVRREPAWRVSVPSPVDITAAPTMPMSTALTVSGRGWYGKAKARVARRRD